MTRLLKFEHRDLTSAGPRSISLVLVFPQNFKIRVLDPDLQEQSEDLKRDCTDFSERVASLSGIVKEYVEHLELQRGRIDAEKMQAVGLR